MNIIGIVIPGLLDVDMNPMADSVARIIRIQACSIAGRARSLAGKGGRPMEIEEREKKTKVWYTS